MNDTGWFTVALVVALGAALRPQSLARRFERGGGGSSSEVGHEPFRRGWGHGRPAGAPSAADDDTRPVATERARLSSRSLGRGDSRLSSQAGGPLARRRLTGDRPLAGTAVIGEVQSIAIDQPYSRRLGPEFGDLKSATDNEPVVRRRRRGTPVSDSGAFINTHPVSHERPLSVVRRLLRKRGDRGGLARWCDDLARAVRGGSTLSAALRTVPAPQSAGINTTTKAVLQQLDRGRSLTESVHEAVTISAESATRRSGVLRTEVADVRLVLTVIEQCAAAGGSLADPLERAAAVLRSRDAARSEVAAQSASARLSAVVLTLLPVGMLMLLVATSPATRAAIATPLGLGITTVGLALNLIGWRWMQGLVGAIQ